MTLLLATDARRSTAHIRASRPSRSPGVPSRIVMRPRARGVSLAALLLGAAALVTARPAPAAAQSALGYGDDAVTIPSGTLRVGFTNVWGRWDQRFTDPSGASIVTNAQSRRTPIVIDAGLTNRVMLRVMVPSVGTEEYATYYSATTPAGHADSVHSYDHNALGDAEASITFQWLGAQPESLRTAPSGFHVRSSVTALALIGTGAPPRPTTQFGLGTGDGQNGVEVASKWDLLMGHAFWTSIIARYGRRVADHALVRVATPGNPFDSNAAPVTAARTLGDYQVLEVTPRIGLGGYFSLGAQYRIVHHMTDHFTGTLDTTTADGAPLHLDASILDAGSAYTEQWAGLGLVYSTVSAFERRQGDYPFELSLQYARVVTTSGGRPTKSEWAVGLRTWLRLWGRGLRAPGAERDAAHDAPHDAPRAP